MRGLIFGLVAVFAVALAMAIPGNARAGGFGFAQPACAVQQVVAIPQAVVVPQVQYQVVQPVVQPQVILQQQAVAVPVLKQQAVVQKQVIQKQQFQPQVFQKQRFQRQRSILPQRQQIRQFSVQRSVIR